MDGRDSARLGRGPFPETRLPSTSQERVVGDQGLGRGLKWLWALPSPFMHPSPGALSQRLGATPRGQLTTRPGLGVVPGEVTRAPRIPHQV